MCAGCKLSADADAATQGRCNAGGCTGWASESSMWQLDAVLDNGNCGARPSIYISCIRSSG